MYNDYVDELYGTFFDDLNIKNNIVLAWDTTVIKVPNVSKIKEEFPVEEGKPARSRLSMLLMYNQVLYSTQKSLKKKNNEVKLAM